MKTTLAPVADRLFAATSGNKKQPKNHFIKVMKMLIKKGDTSGMTLRFVTASLFHDVDLSQEKTLQLTRRLLALPKQECKNLVTSYALQYALPERTTLNFSKHIVSFVGDNKNLLTSTTLEQIREQKKEFKRRKEAIDSLNPAYLLDCVQSDCMALKTVSVRNEVRGMGKGKLESMFTCSACNCTYD
jgi:hypothetical protein